MSICYQHCFTQHSLTSIFPQVDDSFLSEPALDSVDEQSHILSTSMQQAFRGFTYEAPSGLESVR